MRPSDLILRCYAERDPDGSWFAICIDLNLYTRGDSLAEVRSNLSMLVRDYVQEAVTVDKEHADGLIPRRAPLYFWVRYYFWKALVWLCVRLDGAKQGQANRQSFKETLPLVPA